MWLPTVLRRASRLTAALTACLLVVLLGPIGTAWATHSPVPLPSTGPGQAPVATGWTCHGTSSTTTGLTSQECHVNGWALSKAPASLPLPLPVVEQSPLAHPAPVPFPTVIGVYAGSALPVVEQSPQATSGGGDTLNCAPAGSSPSPQASPDGTAPSPSSSPSDTSTASMQSCVLTASLVEGQAFGLWLFLGALVMLGVFTVIRREGRGFRNG